MEGEQQRWLIAGTALSDTLELTREYTVSTPGLSLSPETSPNLGLLCSLLEHSPLKNHYKICQIHSHYNQISYQRKFTQETSCARGVTTWGLQSNRHISNVTFNLSVEPLWVGLYRDFIKWEVHNLLCLGNSVWFLEIVWIQSQVCRVHSEIIDNLL